MGVDEFAKKVNNKTVLITGATGFLGNRIVESISLHYPGAKIVALVRDANTISERIKSLDNILIVEQDVKEPIEYEGTVNFIIHGAAITKSKQFVENPIGTMLTNIDGTKNVLEFASKKNVEKVVFLSTVEIYGTKGYGSTIVGENDYGYVDILDVRSSYPESKKMCETMCMAYYSQKSVPVVIARLCQVFGPGIRDGDSRMFAQFLQTAANNKDIVLLTEGTTVRGYCYIDDAVSAVVTLIINGKAGEAYTVCNESMTMSVKDVAEIIADTCGVGVRIEKNDDTAKGYLKPFVMRLSTAKMQELGWKPEIDMKTAIEMTIKSLRAKEQTT